jgi:hypothetical protein
MIIKINTMNGEELVYKDAEVISLRIRIRQNEYTNLRADVDCNMVERFEFNRESEGE